MSLNKFGWAVFLFLASISIGILGFMNIEELKFINALYMTILTLSTVGFTEVRELTDSGRIFTSVYIIFNLGVYAYAVTIITQYLLEGGIKRRFEQIRKDKKIQKMNNHVIVCGFGRNGSKAAEELLKNNIPLVIIEKNEEKHLKHDPRFKDAVFIAGNATTDEPLKKAGIHKAKGIISSLPSDADNVMIALTAREMNHEIFILVRASDPSSEKRLKRAGADSVVMPDFIGGLHMAGLFLKKQNPEFINIPTHSHNNDYSFEEIRFKDLGDHFIGKRISEINNVLKDAMIVGFKDKKDKIIVNPNDDVSFKPEDILLMVSGGK